MEDYFAFLRSIGIFDLAGSPVVSHAFIEGIFSAHGLLSELAAPAKSALELGVVGPG